MKKIQGNNNRNNTINSNYNPSIHRPADLHAMKLSKINRIKVSKLENKMMAW
jgi:hypothetical protein